MGNSLLKRERADYHNYQLWLSRNARMKSPPPRFRTGWTSRKADSRGVLIACAAGLGIGIGIGHISKTEEVHHGKRLLPTRRRK